MDSKCFDNVEIVRSLGRGTFGVVTLVRIHPQACTSPQGVLVVQKSIALEESPSGEEAPKFEQLYREAQILSSCSHPHIIRFLHAARHPGALLIFMEYAAGGTLEAHLRAQRRVSRPFASSAVSQWLFQIASALHFVHSSSIIHRDIKTANIMLTSSQQIKLGDFGVSRPISSYTLRDGGASTMAGSPHYLAPEVVSGTQYGFAADIWSLGVVLFELLTLQKPFDSEFLATIIMQITLGRYDVNELDKAPHPMKLKKLASSEGMLQLDAESRIGLDEVRMRACMSVHVCHVHTVSSCHAFRSEDLSREAAGEIGTGRTQLRAQTRISLLEFHQSRPAPH